MSEEEMGEFLFAAFMLLMLLVMKIIGGCWEIWSKIKEERIRISGEDEKMRILKELKIGRRDWLERGEEEWSNLNELNLMRVMRELR